MNKRMGTRKGRLFVVGIGPGSREDMTVRAEKVLAGCDLIVGYKLYVDLIGPLLEQKEIITSGMGAETQRCESALREALQGKMVALVSSGDAGIYGMAGLVLEIAKAKGIEDAVEIEIVPGVPAFVAAAAIAGAPLMNDFAAISLSDLLSPWEKIEKKLTAAAAGDFVTCLYNPKSRKRVSQIVRAREIYLQHRDKQTPCAVLRNISRPQETAVTTGLDDLLKHEIDMLSIVIIGNSETRLYGQRMVTLRGYEVSKS